MGYHFPDMLTIRYASSSKAQYSYLLSISSRHPKRVQLQSSPDACLTPMCSHVQRKVDEMWLDQRQWQQKAILNTARMGWFSSDRTIRQYSGDIWNIPL